MLPSNHTSWNLLFTATKIYQMRWNFPRPWVMCWRGAQSEYLPARRACFCVANKYLLWINFLKKVFITCKCRYKFSFAFNIVLNGCLGIYYCSLGVYSISYVVNDWTVTYGKKARLLSLVAYLQKRHSLSIFPSKRCDFQVFGWKWTQTSFEENIEKFAMKIVPFLVGVTLYLGCATNQEVRQIDSHIHSMQSLVNQLQL